MLNAESFEEGEQMAMNEIEMTKHRQTIKRKFIAICVGAVLLLCGYSASFVLQTSVNIDAGLGSKTVTTTYCTSMFCCLFVAPFFMRLFGIKKVMISAEFCYVLYVCANIYPEPTIMIIGGVLAGYAEGLYWLTLFIIFVYYGNIYHKYSSKSVTDCVLQFCGLGFGTVQFNQVLGNLSTFLIFYFLGSNVKEPNEAEGADLFPNDTYIFSHNQSSNTVVATYANVAGRSLANCGINDCQDPNVTSTDIEQYVPQNRVVIYVMIGCFILLMLCGILLHVFLMDEIPLDILNNKEKTIKNNINNNNNHISNNNNNNNNNAKYPEELKKLSYDIEAKHDKLKEKAKTLSLKELSIVSFEAVRATFSQLMKGSQWLITPITISYGFSGGFLYSEVTRAFTSCILGVSQVGISVSCYSIGYMICCAAIGKFCVKFGKLPMIVIAYLLHMINFVGYLIWKPSLEYSWIVYGFFALFGIVNALWSISLNSVYGSNAYKSKEISLNVFNTLIAAGISLQFGISTLLCVREKVYLVIAATTFGTILLVLREVRERASQREPA